MGTTLHDIAPRRRDEDTSINFHEKDLQFAKVREIDGVSVTLLVDEMSRRLGNIDYTVDLGAFILIQAPQSELIATISSIRVIAIPSNNAAKEEQPKTIEKRIVTCLLVGYLRNGNTFERGIERYPTVDSPAYLLTERALTSMFGKRADCIEIGERCQRGGGQEVARVDRLFGRHTAILGTSGSGKSWTVASLLQTARKQMPHTRILFIDIHDEYKTAFPNPEGSRKVTHIAAQNFKLPYWCLNADELEDLFMAKENTAQNQSAIFRKSIMDLRNEASKEDKLNLERISVDTPVYFSFESLIKRLETETSSKVSLSNLIMRMKTRQSDPRYRFLFPEDEPKSDYLLMLFDHLLGLRTCSTMTVLDLSGLPSEVLSTIVGVICRLVFEYKYWDRDPNTVPVTIVLEEAHNYLPKSDLARHRICLEHTERIAKEGRKYGVSMFVISQRPSEVSETILSQCANFIALRLTNPTDQNYVRSLLPDFLAVAVDMLPFLKTGEAVFAGEAVDIPTRVKINQPNPPPRSHDIRYLDGWKTGLPENYQPASVIDCWRKRER